MEKEKIICDTDVLIDYFDHNRIRHEGTVVILEQKIGLENIFISSITKMELFLGASNKRELNTIQKKLNRFSLILINPSINLNAIELIQAYRMSHGLAIPDALIAATSIQTDLKLFTYNIKDFKFIEKLNLFNP